MNLDTSLKAKTNETLNEHSERAVEIASKILDIADAIFVRMVPDLPSAFFISPNGTEAERKEEVRAFLLEVVWFHDAGKVNPWFQAHINGQRASKGSRRHAVYSFFLWWIAAYDRFADAEDAFRSRSFFAFASINGHHGSLCSLKEEVPRLLSILDQRQLVEWGVTTEQEVERLIDFLYEVEEEPLPDDSLAILTLQKVVYAVLVVSDSLASSDGIENVEETLFEVMERNVATEQTMDPFWKSPVMSKVNNSLLTADDSFSDVGSLEDVRILLNLKAQDAYHSDASVYILDAPVGSGKTLSSLALADTIVREKGLRSIKAVFPLNSVQAQFAHTLTTEVGVPNHSLAVINAGSLYGLDEVENRAKGKTMTPADQWLTERRMASHPIVITSHVHFFQLMGALSRRNALGFLNLRDSVVIVDEFQNYPDHYWLGIWPDLMMIGKWLNITWIFTSGTFPVPADQLEGYTEDIAWVLTKEEKEALYAHEAVCSRTSIHSLQDEPFDTIAHAASGIGNKIEEALLRGENQFVVCMSLVRHTKEMADRLNERFPGIPVYFLCGRHNRPYKNALIRRMKTHNQRREDRAILVTTKTVECGMDFDFDIGFKEWDAFDSVEQLSGRVNRSNLRETGSVFTFQFERSTRWPLPHEKKYPSRSSSLDLLKEKKFEELYKAVYESNRMHVKDYATLVETWHKRADFIAYRNHLTIIEENGGTVEFLLVHQEELALFKTKIESIPVGSSYAERVIASKRVADILDSYTMEATVSWIEAMERVGVMVFFGSSRVPYWVVQKEGLFQASVDTYIIDGHVSWVERSRPQS